MTEDSDKKDACQKLYEDYIELVKKTERCMQISGRRVEAKYVKPEDLNRLEEIRLQLLDCKDCLKFSPKEWFEIEKR